MPATVHELEAACQAYDAAAWQAFHGVDLGQQWWDSSVRLLYNLAAGEPVPMLPVRSPVGEPVHLDAGFDCASWYAADVKSDERSAFAVGPPLFVAMAMAGAAVANRRARELAEERARPQWRPHGQVQVLVTSNATWIGRGGGWRRYEHSTVTGIEVAGQVLVVRFGAVPVRLTGPAVWYLAVLVTYLQQGASRLVEAPHLEPVRQAALQQARLAGAVV